MAEGDQVRPEGGPGYAGPRGRPRNPALVLKVQYPQLVPAGVVGLGKVSQLSVQGGP